VNAFALKGIAKSHGAQPVLKGVTIEAGEGEFIDEGSVVMSGHDVTALPAARRNIAMVFQSYALYPHLTAGQNIAVPLAMRELSGAQRTVFFLPVVSLIVAMATVWQYLLHPTIGPVDQLLHLSGLPGPNWLGSSDTVLIKPAAE